MSSWLQVTNDSVRETMFPHVCMFHKKSWVLASYLCRLYYNGLFKNLPLLLFVGDICFFVCRPVDHAVSVLTDMWGSSSGRLNQDAINQIPFLILSNIHSFGCSTKRVEFSLLIFADCIIMAFLKSSFTLICRWYMFFWMMACWPCCQYSCRYVGMKLW
jgi:hypothetical protein